MTNDLPYLNGAPANGTPLNAPDTQSLPILNESTGYGGGQVTQTMANVASGMGGTGADDSNGQSL